MIKLRNLHPLMTANYMLEFLSYLPGQQIQELLQTNISQTSAFIQQAMHQIMTNESVTWGITTKNKQKLVGIITIRLEDNKQAVIEAECAGDLPIEIILRIKSLLAMQLPAFTVSIDPQSDNQTQLKNNL
ncbi:hypothetical protein [Bombilactobacillus thymidiniphilus]|uniref:N-acetyltransferase domain-containing protein n=1 Tax=Bombilactobacillus thymidiniphilus TaxID=2923363 RepID=A0ABY4PFS4_9LACO|nr:hypothetical protein [Bombilactobacillus thymidiniphilus]UQS84162.1 hypothetical protein MOO47_03145 [Bombilactobacillus thymidiniphilus]